MTLLKLRPSASPIWTKCPASVRAQADYPDTAGPEALEGTIAHSVLETCLKTGEVDADGYIGTLVTEWAPILELEKHGDFFRDDKGDWKKIDREMAVGVNRFLEVAWRIGAPWFVSEQRVYAHHIEETLDGTADFLAYDPATGVIDVVDFKFGYVLVECSSPQLLCYGLAAAKLPQFDGWTKLRLTIVQPRASHPDGPVRTLELDPVDAFEATLFLTAAAAATRDPNAPFVPGGHCRYCKHAPHCKALEESVSNTVAVPAEIQTWQAEDLVRGYKLIPMVEAWVKAVKTRAELHGKAGPLKGFKWVQGRGQRDWKGASTYEPGGNHKAWAEFAKEVAEATGLPIQNVIKKEVLSPAQLEKVLPKDGLETVADKITKKPGSKKLVLESDPGEAIDIHAQKARGFKAHD